MTSSIIVLVAFLILCLGTGYLGSLATADSVQEWYPSIAKPSWTPPDWIFGPVWTSIFVMMALAAWIVWKQAGFRSAGLPFAAFGSQLVLNLSWSVLFFAMRNPGAAFVEIVLLWFAILSTVLLFLKHSRTAALLLVPYLVWVTFAAALNLAIWLMTA